MIFPHIFALSTAAAETENGSSEVLKKKQKEKFKYRRRRDIARARP